MCFFRAATRPCPGPGFTADRLEPSGRGSSGKGQPPGPGRRDDLLELAPADEYGVAPEDIPLSVDL